jgi:hypothetical protein
MSRLPLLSHVPMFGFTVLAFLIVCGIIAIATFLVFKSGQQGTTKLGGCAGCAIGFALLAIAGLATAVCVGVMILTTQDELVRHGPVRSLELELGDHDTADEHAIPPESDGKDSDSAAEMGQGESNAEARPEESDDHKLAPGALRPVTEGRKDTQHPVHLKLVIRGKEYPAKISEWMREHTEGDVSITMTTQGDRTVVDFGLPFTREELKQFKRDLKEALPHMKLPKGIKVQIKDEDD